MIPAAKRAMNARMRLRTEQRKGGKEYVCIMVERVGDVRQYERRSCGKTSGMGVLEFLAVMFRANELLPMNKRMTDTAITKKFLDEFPTSKVAKGMVEGRLTVNHFRGLYNRGKLFSAQRDKIVPPETPSQRYTEQDGKMVVADNRTGRPIDVMNERRRKRAGRPSFSGKGE